MEGVDPWDERVVPYAKRERVKPPQTTEDGTPYPMPDRPPRAYGYCRVSLERQGRNTSLAGQAEAIRQQYAARFATSHPDFRLFEESESAAALRFADRPKGAAILAQILPGDVLIVSKLDRFARRLVDGLAELRDLCRRGIRVLCLDLGPDPISFDGGSGEIVLTLMLWVAQYERKRLIERCTEGQKRARAERKGTPREWKARQATYGTRKAGKSRVPDPEWRRYTQTLMALYRFCRGTLKYTKCDGRYLMLCDRYGLYWYHDYSAKGPTGPKTWRPNHKCIGNWFKKEAAMQKKEHDEGRPPPLPVEEPWREQYDAGTFELIPDIVWCPFPHLGRQK